MGGFLEIFHENAHETNGREVLNGTDLLFIAGQRYGKLVPCRFLGFIISRMDVSNLFVGDIIRADIHAGIEIYTVLKVTLIIIQCIILIDILHIGG